jgi:hypothetical protein
MHVCIIEELIIFTSAVMYAMHLRINPFALHVCPNSEICGQIVHRMMSRFYVCQPFHQVQQFFFSFSNECIQHIHTQEGTVTLDPKANAWNPSMVGCSSADRTILQCAHSFVGK